MRYLLLNVFLLSVAVSTLSAHRAVAAAMRSIPSGSYRPFMPENIRSKVKNKRYSSPISSSPVPIQAFHLDAAPVTNGEFLEFVRKEPKWQRSRVASTFADEQYLSHWRGDLEAEKSTLDLPVTNVSWFAARAYCASMNKRLPLLAEWEYAARPEAYDNKKKWEKTLAEILKWYSIPLGESKLEPVSTKSNCTKYGICGLHGVIWEWVEDFSSVMVADDARASGGDTNLFCGGGALGALDSTDYASFMRFAFRTSLKGRYAIGHLGFRCAK